MNLSTRFSSSSSYSASPKGLFLPRPLLSSSSPPQKPSFAILTLKPLNSSKISHPLATLSSFAEAEGEEKAKIEVNGYHQSTEKTSKEEEEEEELPGMARAFDISSSTASTISICMAVAALASPLLMRSLGRGLGLKTKLMSYVTLLFGFYMAWNIGANDVANAMGTSVGSGALTLRQAVVTAGVLEFAGALMMGTHVTSTMQNGILVVNVFQGNNTLLLAGLLASLAAAGSWLQVINI